MDSLLWEILSEFLKRHRSELVQYIAEEYMPAEPQTVAQLIMMVVRERTLCGPAEDEA